MAVRHVLVVLALAAPALVAQEDPTLFDILPEPVTVTRVALGAYDQAFSDGLGHWKGWTLEGTIYPAYGHPWVFAATGFDRPEGKGTLLAAGKYFAFGKGSSVLVSLAGGTNADLLPRLRVDVDARFALASGWKFDLEGALSRFAEDQEVRTLQAGPAYQTERWSASLRVQHLMYEPGGASDTGAVLSLRWGGHDFGVWHNLRLAAGRGIVESSAAGGGLVSTTTTTLSGGTGGRFGRRPSGGLTVTTTSEVPAPQERLASLTGHWPLTDRLALKAEATWGEKVSTYRFWGGAIQVVATF